MFDVERSMLEVQIQKKEKVIDIGNTTNSYGSRK